MVDKNKIEILAPAGNFDALVSAVVNGADAVYLGASAFSARSKAGNFTLEELEKSVKYCHLFGVKVYLAVNTLIKPSEYSSAVDLIKSAKNIGVDAFIVQDFVFLSHLQSIMSDIIVHLSTQAGVHNLEGALFAQKLGVSRVVLSRETTLEDVIQIKRNTNLEIEYFVHGALCVSFSGNCYLSSLASGLSGNRGKCLQFCRKEYSCGGKKGYLLSPKDICLDDKLNELLDAGVTSLKIEGRMKRPEYVGEVVKFYRDILDNKSVNRSSISRIYNRGDFCSAYLNNPTENLIYPSLQGHKGEKIGRVISADKKFATIFSKIKLESGDAVKFIRNEREVGTALINRTAETKKSGDGFLYKITFIGNIKCGDEVNITTDCSLMSEISGRSRKIPIEISLKLENNVIFAQAKLENGDIISHGGENILQPALNSPLNYNDLYASFSKLRDTNFELNGFDCEVLGSFFAQKSKLNEFRRKLVDKIEEFILSRYKISQNDLIKVKSLGVLAENPWNFEIFTPKHCIMAQTDDAQIAYKLKDLVDYVAYFPKRYADESVLEVMERLGDRGLLVLPVLSRDDDTKILKKVLESDSIRGVIANNLYGLTLAKDKKVVVGCGLNIVNPDFNCEKILSVEYDGVNYGDNFVYLYGNFPVMTFSHCPKITISGGKCLSCNQENITICDEQNNKFTINFYKIAHCYSQMLNSVPINGLNLAKNGKVNKIFLDFTNQNWDKVCAVLENINGGTSIAENSTAGYFGKKLS